MVSTKIKPRLATGVIIEATMFQVTTWIQYKIYQFFRWIDGTSFKFIKIFADGDNIYNLIYLILTLYSFNYPLCYAILLLDIIKRSQIMQSIIYAIILNWKNLFFTFIYGFIVMYLFAVIGFLKYPSKYQADIGVESNVFYSVYAGTVNYALRQSTLWNPNRKIGKCIPHHCVNFLHFRG